MTKSNTLKKKAQKRMAGEKYYVIRVQKVCGDHIDLDKKLVSYWHGEESMRIKGKLFTDSAGNHYVGCTIVKDLTSKQIQCDTEVFILSTAMRDYLATQAEPILKLLRQKRNNYYAK